MIRRGEIFELGEDLEYEGSFPHGHYLALRDISAEEIREMWHGDRDSGVSELAREIEGGGLAKQVKVPFIWITDGVVAIVGDWSAE